MREWNNIKIIGVDHGYGNIKTAHTCFRTGVTAHDREPTFKNDLLIYEGRYYTIGEGHKEFAADKMTDGDYYILTLAAIGRELNIRKINSARIYLAAGLPLTWVSEQKDAFRRICSIATAWTSPSGARTIMWSLPERTFSHRALPPLQPISGTSRGRICSATSATAP